MAARIDCLPRILSELNPDVGQRALNLTYNAQPVHLVSVVAISGFIPVQRGYQSESSASREL